MIFQLKCNINKSEEVNTDALSIKKYYLSQIPKKKSE